MLVIFLSIICLYITEATEAKGVAFVADAGSSGTRLYAFKWTERIGNQQGNDLKPPQSIPREIQYVKTIEGEPEPLSNKFDVRIADIADADTANRFVAELKRRARHFPTLQHRTNSIPIYIKATAGMRLLSEDTIKRALKLVDDAFRNDPGPFAFEKEHVFVASGTEEAIYDWLSVNFIENEEALKTGGTTYGALDLGGASTQIAFVPGEPRGILNDWASVRPFNHEFRLYAVSHLGYGADQIEYLVAWNVSESNGNNNPCLFTGDHHAYKRSDVYRDDQATLIPQTGYTPPQQEGAHHIKWNHCRDIIKELLNVNNIICKRFYNTQCSINGVYVPHIPPDMEWIAFAAFFDAINNVRPRFKRTRNNLEGDYWSLKNIKMVGRTLCDVPYQQIKSVWFPAIKEKYRYNLCFRLVYVYTLLADAYHFSPTAKKIKFMGKRPDGKEHGWQWGSILYDANLLPYKFNEINVHRAKSGYSNFMNHDMNHDMNHYTDTENEIYKGQTHSSYLTYYWPLILFSMMIIFVSCCLCGLVVLIGVYLVGFYLKTKRINKREYEMV